jgi:predicted glycosyltransferase
MKVWIDLSNSPHPLLFSPIAERLETIGHEVAITVRDNAQTLELARERWNLAEVIGGPSPGGRVAKARAILGRVGELTQWAREHRPDVALSHNSYAQIAAARRAGIRTVTAMDYEHQPANHLAFRLANTLLLPVAMATARIRCKGATRRKTRFYDGLKEEIYLGDFEPDEEMVTAIVGRRDPDDVLVVARTPPSGALYHRSDNPFFADVLCRVCSEPSVLCVVLARRPEQRRAIAALGLANVRLPDRALDARSLMHAADLVIGAGGTMTREAALLRVPTLSLFSGRRPAVDRWLEERGGLQHVDSLDDLPPVRPREHGPRDPAELRARGEKLVREFVGTVIEPDGAGRHVASTVEARG